MEKILLNKNVAKQRIMTKQKILLKKMLNVNKEYCLKNMLKRKRKAKHKKILLNKNVPKQKMLQNMKCF